MGAQIKDPGALAGATGAECKAYGFEGVVYPKAKRPSSGGKSFSKHMQPRHLRATRTLGYCLVADASDVWESAGVVWGARLDPKELACIAFVALRALEPDQREAVFDAAQWGAA